MSPSPIRTVLAAVDPGPGAEPVVRSAALLAGRTGAALHLVHVVESGGGWMGGGNDAARVRRVADARRGMEETAGALGVRAELHVEAGRAHREILARAGAIGADLLVVGANRSGAVQAHFLGSTAERVVHGASCPVLVVREALRLPLNSIAVPTDVRDPVPGAVEAALAWSARLAEGGAPPPVRLVYAGWEVDAEDAPDAEERVVRPALEAMAAKAAAAGGAAVPRIVVDVAWGTDPAHVIGRWAAREGVGLLALATHGSGGLRRLLTGSVAQSITRQAPCPVLLLALEQVEEGGR